MSSTADPYSALITSEHNQRPNFMAVVQTLCAGLGDCTAVINSLPSAFTLGTAIGAQLNVVGQWIGQTRVISLPLVFGFFGFAELGGSADAGQEPFGELTNPTIGGIWFNLSDLTSSTTTLTDAQYTAVLQALVIRNQSQGTAADLAMALNDITGVFGSHIINDTGTLVVNLYVQSASLVQQSLIEYLDILPRPAGVAIGTIIFST